LGLICIGPPLDVIHFNTFDGTDAMGSESSVGGTLGVWFERGLSGSIMGRGAGAVTTGPYEVRAQLGDAAVRMFAANDRMNQMLLEHLDAAAWKAKPSWMIISANDRMLSPEMEMSSAKRLGSAATTLSTCHLAMLEQPAKVAEIIELAAKKALKQ